MTENLQYRLYNASIDPPVDVWPKIAGQLDQTAQQHLAHKLQEATLEPPANAWENIAATLDANKRAPVILISRNWKRWTVAAVAASIVIIAGLLYFRPAQTTGEERVSTTTGQKNNSAATDNTPGNSDRNNNTGSTQGNSIAQQPGSNNAANGNNTRPRMLAFAGATSTPVRYAHVDGPAPESMTNEQKVHLEEVIDQSISMHADAFIAPKQYLTVAAPNGQPAKISAKFTDAVGFVFNNEPTESLDMAIRSFSWQQRFRNWSNKLMSNAAFIPAATNFLDIVELEELLKE